MEPTPEQIAKLPKWAQEHIADVTRQMGVAKRALNEFTDAQTPSAFYTEETLCLSHDDNRSHFVKRYIQGHKVDVEHDGVKLTILLRQDEKGIDLQWHSLNSFMCEVAMVPLGFNKVKILPKELMR